MVQLGRALLRKYRNVRVVIRMALGGCTNRPFYLIVAAHNRRARDGKYLEQVGCYDPLPNRYGLSGFFPLHPMTVTNAERLRKKKAQEAEKTDENEEGEKEELDENQEQQQQN